MLLQYSALEMQIAALVEQQEALKQQIKDAARQAAPAAQLIELAVPGTAVRYAVKYRESWRLDGKAIAAEDPLTYVKYGRKTISWELRRVKP
jgi:hypothetical protein